MTPTAPIILITSRRLWLGVAAAALIACSPGGAGGPGPAEPDAWATAEFAQDASDLLMDEDITYGILDNGLRYAVMENGTPSETATLLMRIDAGSLDESDDTRGLAHFLEHMAFNGSENIPEGEMTKRLERLGLSFGADTNASTSFDVTTYQLELPDVSDELLDEALMIMRETADRLTLDPEAIDRERGVILAERRARNSPGFRAAVESLRFQTEPSGLVDRLPIGTPETIESVTPEDFRTFYEAQYRPEDTFVVLVGDRSKEELTAKIEAAFGDWQAEGEGTVDAEVPPYALDTPRFGAFFDPEITTRATLFTVAPPRPDARERDTKANRAAELPLSLAYAMLNRRYSRLVTRGEAEFTGAGASTSTGYGDVRQSSLTVVAEHDAIASAVQQAERELRRAIEHGFSQAEFDEQVASLRNRYEVAVQTASTRRTPRLARMILGAFGNENVVTSAAQDLANFEEALAGLSLADAERALQDAWTRLDTAPQLFLQSDTEIEDAEAFLEDVLAESREVSLPALDESEAAEFAYADWGAPGVVVERSRIDDLDMTTVRFANNVRLTMKTTPYEADIVRVRVRAGNGSGQFDPADPAFSTQIGFLMPRSGLGAHDVDEIATVTAGKTVGVSRGFGAEAMTLSGTTTPRDLDLQMQLMAAYLTDPGYREDVVPNFQKQVRQVWDKFDSTPGGAANVYIPPILYDGHAIGETAEEADVVDADLAQIRTWYDENVRGGAVEIAVVGDIDEDAVIEAVARTFGTLPERPDPEVDIRDDRLDYAMTSGRVEPHVVYHKGEPDTALVRVYWPVPNHDDVLTDRRLGVLSDLLQLELTERVREGEGASYSPSAYTSLPEHKPDFGFIAASVEVAPDEVDRVTALIETAAAALTDGIDGDLFDRAIKPTLENIESSLENNSLWLGLADEAQSDPSSLDRFRTRETMYQSMTAADIAPLAAQVFDPGRAVRFHVLPAVNPSETPSGGG